MAGTVGCERWLLGQSMPEHPENLPVRKATEALDREFWGLWFSADDTQPQVDPTASDPASTFKDPRQAPRWIRGQWRALSTEEWQRWGRYLQQKHAEKMLVVSQLFAQKTQTISAQQKEALRASCVNLLRAPDR